MKDGESETARPFWGIRAGARAAWGLEKLSVVPRQLGFLAREFTNIKP